MKVFTLKDKYIIDKPTFIKRLDPNNGWVVSTKEESIKIVSCLQKNSWDGTVVHYYQDREIEQKILAEYYLDSTNGAVHYQHHIYLVLYNYSIHDVTTSGMQKPVKAIGEKELK
jgi:hypothetical protein